MPVRASVYCKRDCWTLGLLIEARNVPTYLPTREECVQAEGAHGMLILPFERCKEEEQLAERLRWSSVASMERSCSMRGDRRNVRWSAKLE